MVRTPVVGRVGFELGRLVLACLCGAGAATAQAQDSPFLPEPLYRLLANELSGDRAFESVRQLSHFHRTGGSKDFFAATEFIRSAAEAAGLEDVKLIRQKWDGHGWSCVSGEAWLQEPAWKLADYGEVRVGIADNSRTTHVSAELVDVGAGASAEDYQGREVRGKIVLASGGLAAVTREAVWKRGALGILSHATSREEALDAPEQVAWAQVPVSAKGIEGVADGTPGTFAVMIAPRRAEALRRLARQGKPLELKVDIEASFAEPPAQAMVEGWIRGSEIHDQQIVLTAHIQEEMTSANDDGSGCASMLEIGRTLARLIKQGKLPRPRRDIRFWWTNELSSEPQYFRENPKEPRKLLLAINQDMVGARQSLGGRVQYAARLPWSIPHALEDVMENVLLLVRDANTSLLTARGSSVPQPFPREVLAVKGSREPFQARMVPYFGHSDHHAFTPARIGVPATSLINWPDGFIHSTGDDLDNIDATQLERNALVVAGVALWFARATDADAGTLGVYVAAQASQRVAQDVATAVTHLVNAPAPVRDRAFREARNLIRQSHRRAMATIGSVRRLGPKGKAAETVNQAIAQQEESVPADLRVLERAYQGISGRELPNLDLSREEREMEKKVFVPLADYGAYEDAMAKVLPVESLHSMMRFEVYNFADGQRSTYEVYEAVAAEALAAGEWYYGKVSAADVLQALERGAKAGAFTLKSGK